MNMKVVLVGHLRHSMLCSSRDGFLLQGVPGIPLAWFLCRAGFLCLCAPSMLIYSIPSENFKSIRLGNYSEGEEEEFQDLLPHTLIARGARCGCLDKEDEDIDLGVGGSEGGEDFVAINVKLFLSEREGSVIHTSPEFRHEPHMTVVVEVRPLRVSVMLNAAEAETQVQAEQDGRLVELERMLEILQFSRGAGKRKGVDGVPGEEESHTAV